MVIQAICTPILSRCQDEAIIDALSAGVALSNIKTENTPDPAMMGIIIKNLRLHCGNIGVLELYTAFELNAAGQDWEYVNAYGNFDLKFVMDLMHQWSVYRLSVRRKVSELAAANKPKALQEAQATPESLYSGLVDYVTKNGDFPLLWPWDKVFEHMDQAGMILLDNKERNEFKRKMADKLRAQDKAVELDLKNMMEIEKLGETFESRLRSLCRKEMIMQHLKSK